MKGWRDVRPAVRRALESTGAQVDFRNRHAPTWDGRMWHFARLRAETHAVHELAHWMALPQCRHMPNYGLGKDPDGGPRTIPEALNLIAPTALESAAKAQDAGDDELWTTLKVLLQGELSWEEEIATVLSIRMLHILGIAHWKGEAMRCHLLDPKNEWKVWAAAEILAERGVDVYDPLPGGVVSSHAQGPHLDAIRRRARDRGVRHHEALVPQP